jgi:hypothetical protein
MGTELIIRELEAERDRLDAAINALTGNRSGRAGARGRRPGGIAVFWLSASRIHKYSRVHTRSQVENLFQGAAFQLGSIDTSQLRPVNKLSSFTTVPRKGLLTSRLEKRASIYPASALGGADFSLIESRKSPESGDCAGIQRTVL